MSRGGRGQIGGEGGSELLDLSMKDDTYQDVNMNRRPWVVCPLRVNRPYVFFILHVQNTEYVTKCKNTTLDLGVFRFDARRTNLSEAWCLLSTATSYYKSKFTSTLGGMPFEGHDTSAQG